jgi:DNA helicase II / ATP-dependent DNA helicase PcrA
LLRSQAVDAFMAGPRSIAIREHIGVEIRASSDRATKAEIVETQTDADRLHADSSVVKLFLQKHWLYDCHSHNWGGSKGLDHYQDVCVVLNDQTWRDYQNGELHKAKPITRNKLYVACSRARGNLYLVPDKLFKKFKVK